MTDASRRIYVPGMRRSPTVSIPFLYSDTKQSGGLQVQTQQCRQSSTLHGRTAYVAHKVRHETG